MICLSIFAEDYPSALKDIEKYGRTIAVVELRLDTADSATIEAAVAAIPRPLILTCRPRHQGGGYSGNEADRVRLLTALLRYRPLYLDVELGTPAAELISSYPEQPFILSHHSPNSFPANLEQLAAAAAAKKPAVVKLVPAAEEWDDNLRILKLAAELDRETKSFIAFCSGETGLYSRALAPAYGSALTYCRGETTRATADGQFSLSEAVDMYRPHKIQRDWAVFGIAGDPVARSLSPALHNKLFSTHKLNAVYLPFRVNHFAPFIRFAGKAGIRGLSVTSPHKTAAALHAEPGDMIVRLSAAANTLVLNEDGSCRYTAYNTDGPAAVDLLSEELGDLESKKITVIGLGGAGRAGACSLVRAGAEVTVTARKKLEAREFALALGCRSAFGPEAVAAADAVINATTVAAAEHDTDGFLRPLIPFGSLAVDLHYHPAETWFLREAALRGCRTLNGLPLFLRQAARQFRLWTGILPDKEMMERLPTENPDHLQ